MLPNRAHIQNLHLRTEEWVSLYYGFISNNLACMRVTRAVFLVEIHKKWLYVLPKQFQLVLLICTHCLIEHLCCHPGVRKGSTRGQVTTMMPRGGHGMAPVERNASVLSGIISQEDSDIYYRC